MTSLPRLRPAPLAAALCSLLFLATSAPAQEPAKLDPPVKPSVSGKYLADNKPAALQFVWVEEEEPFSGKQAIALIFTEKDPSKSKKPSFDALFNKLGNALILKVHREEGGIFGCQVAHTGHSKAGFSALGKIKMLEFKYAGGNVTGHVSTGGPQDAFGQSWEVDLKFAAPLPEKLRAASAAPAPALTSASAATPSEPAKPAAKERPVAKREAAAAPTGPAPAARKLPLPGDAKDVEFKALVKQIQFASDKAPGAVADEFAAKLKDQGWKDGPGSVKGPRNAILQRVQGDAKLTIMIQPAGTGSAIKIFGEGLDWSE